MESFDEVDGLNTTWQYQHQPHQHSHATSIGQEQHDDEDAYSLEAFKQKLDDLTESLGNTVILEHVISEASVGNRHSLLSFADQHCESPLLAAKLSPPPRRANAMTDTNSTATTTRGHVPGTTTTTSSVHRRSAPATPEPPTPVKTPLRETSSVRTTPDMYYQAAARRSNNTKIKHTHGGDSVESRSESANDKVEEGRSDEVKELKMVVEHLRDAVGRQEERIRRVEQENALLRSRLYEQGLAHTAPGPSCSPYTDARRQQQRSTTAPSPFFDDVDSWQNQKVSPGTKFVAELAQVIDLPPEQFGPLSRIMDKRLGRLEWESRTRTRHTNY
jgi:hypothetical protein